MVRIGAVCLVSVIAVCVLFEIYLRHAGFLAAQPANYPCITGDPVLNHVFNPHCEGVATAAGLKTARDVTYRTNDLGYRGHAPEAGKRTLVVLGDSYTEGFGLEESEAFPAALERELRAGGAKDWQVLNGGTLGYSPALYALYFDRYFLTAHPEVVLLNLDFTDFTDDSYYLQIADYDSLGRPVAYPGREEFPRWLLPYVYSNRSALLRFVHQEVNQWALAKRRGSEQWHMDMWIHAEHPLIEQPELHAGNLEGCFKSIEAVAKNILVLKAHAAAVGARFAIHMYPPGYVVKSYAQLPQNISFVRGWDAKTRTDFSWACGLNPKVVDVMRAFAKRQGIPFYDSFPVIFARSDKEQLYFDGDAHWNARGVQVVVEHLARELHSFLGLRK